MMTIEELKVQLDNKLKTNRIRFGVKRVGVSISDEKRKIATPLETINAVKLSNLN